VPTANVAVCTAEFLYFAPDGKVCYEYSHKKATEIFSVAFLFQIYQKLFFLYFGCDITFGFQCRGNSVQNFLGVGADGMIVIAACDVHQLGGFSRTDTLDELSHLYSGKNI